MNIALRIVTSLTNQTPEQYKSDSEKDSKSSHMSGKAYYFDSHLILFLLLQRNRHANRHLYYYYVPRFTFFENTELYNINVISYAVYVRVVHVF